MTVKLILTDIEGTTSSITFVKDVLFPYARQHLPEFIRTHRNNPDVQAQLKATAELCSTEGLNLSSDHIEALTQQLIHWIDQDRKATPLKALQGLIWDTGYRQGDYQAHMYPDATEYLQKWHAQGLPLYVYSSGSIKAQKLFFEFSCDGNLLPLFKGHFDTQIGNKREVSAYQAIATVLQEKESVQPEEILFLSDIEEELDAARAAGMQTHWLVREGETTPSRHAAIRSFADIQF